MTEVTVIGPGAIGGLVAAWLCRNPQNSVTVAARTAFATLTLETPSGTIGANPRVLTDRGEASPADWVLVATKSYDSAAAAEWFPHLLGPETCVAVLQNGVTHVERFSQWVAPERILPVIVNCPAERTAPGVIRQRGRATLTVPAGSTGTAFEALFDQTEIQCRQVEDFTTAAWWKLCLNSAGVVNALTLLPAGISRDESTARLMRLIVEEAAAVGRAMGADLSNDIAKEVVEIYCSAQPDSVNSLHADRAAGRPMEIELRHGIIVEAGKRLGIPTPYNDMAVTLLTLAGPN